MKPGNVNESLIFYLKAETNRLLKYDIWGDLPCYHRGPDKGYLPYIHMKLKMALESGNPEHSCIVTLFDKYKKMEAGLLKWEQLIVVVMRLVRMIDSPKMQQHENLTLKRIPLLLEETSFERREIDKKISAIETKLKPLKTWRDKDLAHVDLDYMVFQDEANSFATMFGAYTWIGEKPRGDTVALAYEDRYKKLNDHLDFLKQVNTTGIFDVDIRRVEDWFKKLEKYYDPVTGKQKELYDIGNTYDEINETISEVIDMISDLLDYVGELCKSRYGEVFIPARKGDNDA